MIIINKDIEKRDHFIDFACTAKYKIIFRGLLSFILSEQDLLQKEIYS